MPLPSATVRAACPDDADGLAALGEALRADPYIAVTGFDPITGVPLIKATIEGISQADDSRVFVALVDDAVAGMALCRRFPPPEREGIAQLDIGVDRAKRRRGLGQRLVQHAIDWAETSGVHRIQLSVVVENVAALALYKKCGFEIEGTMRRAFRAGKSLHDVHVMARLST